MLLSAADANRLIWQRGLEKDNPMAYALRHPLSVQRAARINCLAYGSDPELLQPLPGIVELPLYRADWCVEEFTDAEKAWTWVLDNYVHNSSVHNSDVDNVDVRKNKNETMGINSPTAQLRNHAMWRCVSG